MVPGKTMRSIDDPRQDESDFLKRDAMSSRNLYPVEFFNGETITDKTRAMGKHNDAGYIQESDAARIFKRSASGASTPTMSSTSRISTPTVSSQRLHSAERQLGHLYEGGHHCHRHHASCGERRQHLQHRGLQRWVLLRRFRHGQDPHHEQAQRRGIHPGVRCRLPLREVCILRTHNDDEHHIQDLDVRDFLTVQKDTSIVPGEIRRSIDHPKWGESDFSKRDASSSRNLYP